MKKLKKPRSFVIDYNKWVNADVSMRQKGESALLNDAGCYCCLGFYAIACGLKNKDIRCLGCPDDVTNAIIPGITERVSVTNSGKIIQTNMLGRHLMSLNDLPCMANNPRDRMSKIRSKFKTINISVKFKNVPDYLVKEMTKQEKSELLARK